MAHQFKLYNMKKLLFLLLLSVSIYGQTYQNPTFGTVTTKTSPTVTNDPYLTTTGTTGVQGKIAPVNVLIPYTPINYSISGQTIGQQIAAIDAKIGTMGTTSAGVTQRVYFTADNTTVNSVVYFASSLSGKGSTASGSPPALVLADNTKAFFTKDVISIAQPAPTIGYAGTYSGNLTVSASPTPVATQQRFTVEIYRTDNLGVPITSGVSGAPTGDLGVTVLAILDSGIINLTAGSITNIAVSGVLTQNITLNTGERLRYHVSAAKIGTGGGNVTFGVYYGSSYNSYYDVPVAITTDAVINKSTNAGVTSTDALNSLNTLKAPLSNPIFTGNVNVPVPTLPTDAVNKGYADGLVVGLLDDRGSYNASSNLFPTTGGSGSSGTILKGDIWYVSVAGTLGGKTVNIGDSFRALADSPGQTASNWSLLSSNLSYVPANDANVIHTTGNETKSGILTLNNQLKLANGTIANPSILFPDEDASDTGINHTNNGEIQFVTNGSSLTQISGAGVSTNFLNVTMPSIPSTDTYSTAFLQVEGYGYKLKGGIKQLDGGELKLTRVNLANELDVAIFKTNGNVLFNKSTDSGSGSKIQVNGTIEASEAVLSNQVVVKSQLDAVAPSGVKRYKALISQTGTSAPTVIVLENSIGSIVWTRTGVGIYIGTLSNAFTTNKTLSFISDGFITCKKAYKPTSTNTFQINTQDISTLSLSDGQLGGDSILIEVYP